MTQRIFKATDDKDVKELFELLPDYVTNAEPDGEAVKFFDGADCLRSSIKFNINWDGLTEIHRPVDHEQYIGKLGWFWNRRDVRRVGKLINIVEDGLYWDGFSRWDNFRPLTLKEIKEKDLV